MLLELAFKGDYWKVSALVKMCSKNGAIVL